MTTQQRLEYGQDYQIWRARKMLAQGRSPTLFQVGDLVRINLLALSERMRELKEESRVNKLAVYYTPEIYRSVLDPNIKFGGATFLKLLNFSQNSRS